MNEISALLQLYNNHHVVIAGDFNFDFKINSNFKFLFTQFLNDENLSCLSTNFGHNIDFSYESSVGTRSFIDHIIVSDHVFSLTTDYSVEFDGLNLSDYYPLNCAFKLPLCTISNKNKHKNRLAVLSMDT